MQDGEGFCFEVEDRFDFILAHANLERLPQFQCERGVLFSVLSHIHGGKFPKFFFRMDSEVGSGLFETLLRLDFLEIVKSQRVERIAETVLIKNWGCEHGIDDPAVDFKTTCL